jgi:hypothetical protein
LLRSVFAAFFTRCHALFTGLLALLGGEAPFAALLMAALAAFADIPLYT